MKPISDDIARLISRIEDSPRKWAPISGPHLDIKFSEREIDALVKALQKAAALEGSVAAPEWQPIETAPKDGEPIWVCNKHYTAHGFLPLSVRWRTYHPNAKGDPCWRDINGHKVVGIEFWMPIPAPPITRQDRGGGS